MRQGLCTLLAFVALCLSSAQAAEPVNARVLASYGEGLSYPTDLAVDSRAWAFVADGLNRRIVVLDMQARLRDTITLPEFVNPVGVDIMDDRLWVSDPDAHAIFELTLDGRLVNQIELPAICDPVDVLAFKDKLVVSDNDNHRMLFVSHDGGLIKAVGRDANKIRPMASMKNMELPEGSAGDRVEEFKYPGILARHLKSFMVIDVLNGRVQAITPLGNFDRMVGSFGADGDHLFRPKGACSCWNGRGTLVTDSFTGRIQAYDEYADSWGPVLVDGQPWTLEGPTAISCCGDSWWVVDCRGSRVHRFEIPE